MDLSYLISKYNISAPRYTSYPPLPMWKNNITVNDWKVNLNNQIEAIRKEGISIYIHLPFCEQLCTYCGCNKRITKNHQVETPYIDSLLREWQFYKKILGQVTIREIHLGGGTPTFFLPQNLSCLITNLFNENIVADNFQGSVEIHPHFSKNEHLEVLKSLGFNRASIGVQDFDKKVQIAINRTQDFSEVKRLTDYARKIGYKSVNYDIIYGLPFQTKTGLSNTIDKINELTPDRIAFYSYAHVPWIKAAQRKFTEADLPPTSEKIELYLMGIEKFIQNGYQDIGMDHFALPNDDLFLARKNKTLHRNFMGYTTQNSKFLISLGCSSISDSNNMYVQNLKEVEEYQEAVNNDIPIFKGHILTETEQQIKKHILNLLCYFETSWSNDNDVIVMLMQNNTQWNEIIKDNLVIVEKNKITATETGKLLIRNVCYALDKNSQTANSEKPMFSKAI